MKEENMVTSAKSDEGESGVHCMLCGKLPGYVKRCGDGDEVYFALECDCKITPFMRSKTFLEATWVGETFKLSRKDAFEIAVKNSPEWIKISVPSNLE